MTFVKTYKIGTRGSPLALAQAEETRTRLLAAHEGALEPEQLEIRVIKTTGDRIQDRALSEVGGKGLFVKEIEEALISGEIDFAVHSMKDMETELSPELIIDCILPREDARDAFISASGKSLADLPSGSLVGTASLRRQAQILNRRPDLKVDILRGSVETRLRKLAEGKADATLLALAGLKRLGKEDVITELMHVDDMLPAVAQGAIGIERRLEDEEIAALLAPINDSVSYARISCETPIAGYAELVDGNMLDFRASVLATDGSLRFDASGQADISEAIALGERLGKELKVQAEDANLTFVL